jgi:hypothetical protein
LGFFQNETGAVGCKRCPAGYIPGPGSADGSIGAATCVACPVGTSSASGDSVCTACPSGNRFGLACLSSESSSSPLVCACVLPRKTMYSPSHHVLSAHSTLLPPHVPDQAPTLTRRARRTAHCVQRVTSRVLLVPRHALLVPPVCLPTMRARHSAAVPWTCVSSWRTRTSRRRTTLMQKTARIA